MPLTVTVMIAPALLHACLPHPIFVAEFPQSIRERFPPTREIRETLEKVAHGTSPVLARVASAPAGICSPITGKRRTSVM